MTPEEKLPIESQLAEIENIKIEQLQIKEKAWKQAQPQLEGILDRNKFATSPTARESIMLVFKSVWEYGYMAGSSNMARTIAIEAGLGPVVSMMDIAHQQLHSKPENN